MAGKLAAIIFFCAVVAAMPAAAGAKAQLLSKGKWRSVEARVPGDIKGLADAKDAKLGAFGGWKDVKLAGTGFFRVEKVEGRWWLIDPEGYAFITVGMCSVNLGTFDDNAATQKLGGKARWVESAARLLSSHGFNTLGCWSDWPAFRPTSHKMPYTRGWNLMAGYKNVRPPRNGARGYPHECMPAFDAEFEAYCNRRAGKLAETKDDPWLLGHFSDNELPFRPDALDNYLKLPAADVGHKAAKRWLADRGGKITQKLRDEFLEYLATRYYTIVGRAIRKRDPNHLFLGSRIHGRTIRPAVFRGSKSVDVVSVNYYHRWSVEPDRLANWAKLSGRPFIVSEWYAMSLDTARNPVTGAGFRVKTDRGRGLFYQNLTLGLLERPGCVGWHWFKYGGDTPGCHKGAVDRGFKPHRAMLDLMREVNERVYALREVLCRGE